MALLGFSLLAVGSSLYINSLSFWSNLKIYLVYLAGVGLSALGSIFKESHFRCHEIDVARFHCIDQMFKFLFLSAVAYPLVSRVQCSALGALAAQLCTEGILDHPVLALGVLGDLKADGGKLRWVLAALGASVVLYNVHQYASIKLTQTASKAKKLALKCCAVLLVLAAEAAMSGTPKLRKEKPSLERVLLDLALNLLGLFCFVFASILVHEILPLRFWGLNKYFGRYNFYWQSPTEPGTPGPARSPPDFLNSSFQSQFSTL